MHVKLGRRPVRHTGRMRRSMLVMTQHLSSLGPAPSETNNYMGAVTVPWGMMLNDTLGDCVCADSGHTLMLRSANSGKIIIPTDADIEHLYEEVGGYIAGDSKTDNGCDETSMEQYLTSTGLCGQKLDDSGSVDYTSLDHLIWSIQLFGSVRLGINFPAWAMSAFSSQQPWGAPPVGVDTTIEGGHDVPIVDYRGGNFTCITWGQEQVITMDFLNLYCEEAHVELAFNWIAAQGNTPNGFSLSQLDADLKDITNA